MFFVFHPLSNEAEIVKPPPPIHIIAYCYEVDWGGDSCPPPPGPARAPGRVPIRPPSSRDPSSLHRSCFKTSKEGGGGV